MEDLGQFEDNTGGKRVAADNDTTTREAVIHDGSHLTLTLPKEGPSILWSVEILHVELSKSRILQKFLETLHVPWESSKQCIKALG